MTGTTSDEINGEGDDLTTVVTLPDGREVLVHYSLEPPDPENGVMETLVDDWSVDDRSFLSLSDMEFIEDVLDALAAQADNQASGE